MVNVGSVHTPQSPIDSVSPGHRGIGVDALRLCSNMSSSQPSMNFPVRRSSGFQAAGPDATAVSPIHTENLDMAQFIIDSSQHAQNPTLLQTSPPSLNALSNQQISDFSFSYHNVPEPSLDNEQDPYNLPMQESPSGHRSSTTSMPAAAQVNYNGAAAGGQVGNASVSDGSEAASPTSNRAGGALENGYGDEFGLNSAVPVDGSDLGARSKEEKNDPTPPWSDLKTKAGKERKRLPLACIACRRKKIRCSGEKPACKHCLRSRIPCVYKVTTRKAAPRTDYMAMLDKRLKRMEERIIKIIPKTEQESAAPIVRATVKPGIPGAIPVRSSTGKKRAAEEAFASDLESWSKSTSTPLADNTTKPVSLIVQETQESELLSEGADALPSKEIQEHLSEVFFENVYGQTYHLLHKPSFMRKLKSVYRYFLFLRWVLIPFRSGTLPPVLILAVCAISARFSTHPKLNATPIFLRGEEWASEARNIVIRRYDWPNITILTCLLILGLHEFGTCQGGRSWAFGGQAIRMAFALQLHKDLDHDPQKRNDRTPLSFIDREIRRRTMWACFLMDRLNSSGTDRPTFINQDQMKIPLPIKEKYFQLDIPGPTENLSGQVLQPVTPAAGELSNPKENMGVAAHMIRAIALWGRIINYLNLGGKEDDAHPMWHPNSGYASLIKQTEAFSESLPESLRYSRENFRSHEIEGVANQFLFLHIAIQQNILFMNRFAVPGHTSGRTPKDAPKDFVTKAGAKAFEAANSISGLLRDSESCLVTAPFTGYCAFLSSTVHVFGVFSKNAAMEATSKKNLATNIKYLAKMKRYWGMFHYMSENLKDQYRMYADASRQGSSTSGVKHPSAQIFQYGDWFDRYPHGVSQGEFDDPAVKVEKGEDAVLEQKSDYRTVEEFFNSLSPQPSHSKETTKSHKRKAKRNPPQRQDQHVSVDTNLTAGPPLQVPNAHQIPPSYNQLSPTTPVSMYNQPYYGLDFLLPAQQQGILPQLDRQLVFGAYAGMDPSQGLLDGSNAWDIPMSGLTGFVTEPSSAWMIPFNMEPPEMGQDADVMNAMGGPAAGYGMNNGMGGN